MAAKWNKSKKRADFACNERERERERERGSLGSETAAPVVFLAFFVVELKEFTGKNALDPELRRL